MTVKVLKLITGEEVVAEVVDAQYTVELTNPVALVMQNGPQGLGQTIVPWAHGCKHPISLGIENVIYQADPTDDLLTAYNQAFSKVQVSKKQLIV